MRDEQNPFAGLWGGDNLLLGREPVCDVRRQVPTSQSSLTSFSVMEEASHLPLKPDPDMAGEVFGSGKIEVWVLELEDGKAGEGRRRGEKRGIFMLLYRK